jgi:putative membrane protein
MQTNRLSLLIPIILAFASLPLMAADSTGAPSWHAQTLLQAIGNVLLFTVIGILAAIGGYKLFDKCTPGDLTREILEHRNVAAAIIGGAVILGVCIIVAAAMLG